MIFGYFTDILSCAVCANVSNFNYFDLKTKVELCLQDLDTKYCPKMKRFDPQTISKDEKDAFIKTISDKSNDIDSRGHVIWKPPPNAKTGYPELKLHPPLAERFNIFSAKNPGHILYIFENNIILNRFNYEMSHLCHIKTCINPNHLSYEPKWMNSVRRNCAKTRNCSGHRSAKTEYKNCIF